MKYKKVVAFASGVVFLMVTFGHKLQEFWCNSRQKSNLLICISVMLKLF